ncbi:MAG: malic enzyme-like NAD(P)-binding protein, partial [Halopseudomonas sp.]
AKPVMEGKAVLFGKFADIDSIDLEVDTKDVDEFIRCVSLLGKTFGGINLEDIKAPGCFVIEDELQKRLDIPVFHDDQHGTAIICAAGTINALELTGRNIKETKLVVSGAGSAAIRCVEMVKALGMPDENVIMCDSRGVMHTGRDDLNQWKQPHAVKTKLRTLKEALVGADMLFGLSMEGIISKEMVGSMGGNPIIFAMANPNPEISPEDIKSVRSDAIIATGRSDYPNQINNVLAFPYIFRGALDVRATTVNQEMKVAAAEALSKLAREEVPAMLSELYAGKDLSFGPEYIIPTPFDPRLLAYVSVAVAKAAMDTGVANKKIEDLDQYFNDLLTLLED